MGKVQGIIERAQECKILGRAKWLRRQVEKMNQGFENHTGKCYRVSRSDAPLELKEEGV